MAMRHKKRYRLAQKLAQRRAQLAWDEGGSESEWLLVMIVDADAAI